MIQVITGAALKDMVLNAAAAIGANKQQINELNVFPVPDGDTGTNMSLTIGAGAAELKKLTPETVTQVADKTANALLRGARGNSGVILSLLFRGLAKSLKGLETANAAAFAAAMAEGVSSAYSAVMKPTEGTILTVSRLCAQAAVEFAQENDDIDAMLDAALAVGAQALLETTEQNPVLKKAGVVDAGAKGYLYILEGMQKALRGEMLAEAEEDDAVAEKADFSEFKTEDITFAYCTEFIVGRDNMKSADVLRDFLSGIGDSIVVVDDDEIIKVHVHTNAPGNVLTEALTYGQLLTVKIENMREQHSEMKNGAQEAEEPVDAAPQKKYGTVAVCAGDGLDAVFRDLGVDALITGGQTMNPSTEDILSAICRTPAEIVYVFPNNKNIIMAAQQCVPLTQKKVIVMQSKTVPQGIAALLAMDDSLEEEALTEAFAEAIGHVHTAQITYAARDSEFDGHSIAAGEYLAMLEGTLVANGKEFPEVLDTVGRELAAFDPEFLTIYYGADVDQEAAEAVSAQLEAQVPGAEVTLVYGGQPVYYYMISAE